MHRSSKETMLYIIIISCSILWALFALYSPKLSHLDKEHEQQHMKDD